MPDPTDTLVHLLDLEPMDEAGDVYIGATPPDIGEGPRRLFGGQVAAQALRAATLTVDSGRPPHSFHAYFIRPGRPGVPLRLDVARTRDGRSFTTRHVTASQEDEPIFEMIASFHHAEDGDDWQLPGPVDVPGPEEVPASEGAPFRGEMAPFDIRPVARRRAGSEGWVPISHPMWLRTRRPLPDDPIVHAAVIAFLSDMGMMVGARRPGSVFRPGFMGASLDHAVWFHRPARADEWLLFSVDPQTNYGARGLARGTMHTRDGVLVASVAQEAVLRG